MKRKYWAIAALVLAAAVVCLVLLRPWAHPASGVRVLVDGKELTSASVSPEKTEDLRVYLTLDGKELASLPFSEAHTVRVLQENGDLGSQHRYEPDGLGDCSRQSQSRSLA